MNDLFDFDNMGFFGLLILILTAPLWIAFWAVAVLVKQELK